MSNHAYTFYVARPKASKCQCDQYKAEKLAFCSACLERIPAGLKQNLNNAAGGALPFKDFITIYDLAEEWLSQWART